MGFVQSFLVGFFFSPNKDKNKIKIKIKIKSKFKKRVKIPKNDTGSSERGELCKKHQPPNDFQFHIDHLSLSVYENRSQESIIAEKWLSLNKQHVQYFIYTYAYEYRGSALSLQLKVEDESDENYLKDGNRSSYYRRPCIGMSLIHRFAHSEKYNMSLKSSDKSLKDVNKDADTNTTSDTTTTTETITKADTTTTTEIDTSHRDDKKISKLNRMRSKNPSNPNPTTTLQLGL
ncbi:hypothetical protein RFI_11968 [Reticulomyxa filosa]|uniref:Uncharacterized protein n=1 Tax=Reticulomyxa filosa TaxID=46433 RepID=X6NGQ4_RETFI|nr:hypothetical protein RFI_11968 [Reticulomyxa filosa]|eukprot:ETO25176.1 hypothetical protein RFI_11968 [Reticulomyxa filosa]